MKELTSEIVNLLLSAAPQEGFNKTPVPGVYCIKFSKVDQFANTKWLSSVMIVAQGQKEIALESRVPEYSEAHYLASPIDLPVTSRVKAATAKKPYIGLLFKLDLDVVTEIASKMRFSNSDKIEMRTHAIFTGKADSQMLEATPRLIKLFKKPEDIPLLAPFAIKEIFYYILKGPNGKAIYEFAKAGTKFYKLSESIQKIRSDLSQEVDVSRLAEQANMSRASFFKSFKNATSMSPIQYQKRLRLIEARRLIIDERASAESAAFSVGYKSASQFSREYSRMFGKPPLKDALSSKVP